MPAPINISFSCAQNFYVDSQLVNGATEIQISAVELFFKNKPIAIENTLAGMPNCGASIFITETEFGVPKVDFVHTPKYARVEYEDIVATSDASIPTKFRWETPYTVKTDTEYAFVVKYDFNDAEFFRLWKNVQGEYIVGTTTVSPGTSGTNAGAYFEFASGLMDPTTANLNWRPLSDTSLKFNVFASRYAIDGNPVANVVLLPNVELITPRPRGTFVDYVDGSFIIPSNKMEFFTYNESTSTREVFVGGQKLYQNTVFYPGGKNAHTVATYSNNLIVASSTLPNGAPFSWSSIFPGSDNRYIVVFDSTYVNIRKVVSIISNTHLEVEEPISFTNNVSKFMITPVAKISQFNKSSPYGVSESIIFALDSTANSTVRFVNNCIEYLAPVSGGSGYSNNDIVYVKGFEYITTELEGGYVAVGHITTNSTGGITDVAMANLGCGFINAEAVSYVVANSSSGNTTANTSAGFGATFSYNAGCTLRTELRDANIFRNCKVMNVPISDVLPFFEVTSPSGASYDLELETRYIRKKTANTFTGFAYYVSPNTNIIQLHMYQRSPILADNAAIFLSRSNEFNTKYANGAPNDQINANYSNSIVMSIHVASNNDYVAPTVNSLPVASFSKYIINNDYTNEHTDRGAAWAKGLTKRVNFKRRSEDLWVYLTAYRPACTSIEVYARLYNIEDPEAFDDKDWTRLEHEDIQTIYSSPTDGSDMIELAYSLGQHPNVEFTCAGVVTAANNSADITGVGTTFSANLAVGDLVRVYPVLFPNTNIIAVVNAITSNTVLTLNTTITNNEFLGQTLNIDKLEYKHQAFNNIMNDNVVRYYNTSMIEFDGYHMLQVKTVLLTMHPNRVPRVDDIRLAGTTA